MKKGLCFILALVMCLTLCACGCEHEWSGCEHEWSECEHEWSECEHEWSDWKTVKKATCFEDGSQKRTCSLCNEVESAIINKTVDCGSKLSDGVMENLAKNYVKDQFKQTAGGYEITRYTFGSISKAGNDDLNIYQWHMALMHIMEKTSLDKPKKERIPLLIMLRCISGPRIRMASER